jgi:hypothetical protein
LNIIAHFYLFLFLLLFFLLLCQNQLLSSSFRILN